MNKRLYFPNFDAIRGIGAFVVFLVHLSSAQSLGGFKVFFKVPIQDDIILVLFFAISGFLITYLLFTEKERYKDINLKKYFVRRILRIWPMYYLLIILSIFILPSISFLHLESTKEFHFSKLTNYDLICFFLILPNITLNYVPFTTQTWSIGVEEQFYFIQPYINKYLNNKKTIVIVLLLIVFSSLIIFFPLLIGGKYKELSPNVGLVVAKIYMSFSYFGCVAIGALTAVVYYYQDQKILKFIYSKFTQVFSYAFLAFMTVVHHKYKFEFDPRFYGATFAIIVLNMGTNPKNLINLDHKVFNYLGKISYSFYMLHILTIVIVMNLLVRFLGYNFESIFENIVFYTTSYAFTVFVSHLFFQYFEKPILGLKDKFSV